MAFRKLFKGGRKKMYIDDNYLNMKRHILNLQKQVQYTSDSGGRIQYQIISDNEALINSLLNGNNDGYPLRKEVKRDRYVLNSEAMRKAMIDATTKALNDLEKEIVAYLNKDVSNIVEQITTNTLDDIVFDGLNFTSTRQHNQTQDWAYKLGAEFGKALGNAIWDAFEDTLKPA